ncbi:hypothetical protein HOF78_00965 [Candidatus Woesearchaeota archaeon]|jgi:Icc-related predicted phosphoesterase|nr:hypothetical protein [Candidatus Woesearchaeota archaeon]MBT6045043.1 hypothetical protein [Candidatus Woesearchaeota archaeon]
MKFLIVGDLHGRIPKIHFKEFDAIIVPGDICSDKGMRKYVGLWKKHIKKTKEIISSDEYILKLIGRKKYNQIEKESLLIGRKTLEFLNKFNKPIFFTPGNWDQSHGTTNIKDSSKSRYNRLKSNLDMYLSKHSNKILTQGLKNVKDCQYKLHKFGNFNIIGYGLCSGPEKPNGNQGLTFKEQTKLKKAYNKILNRLVALHKRRNRDFTDIFISHNVPYKTKVDIILEKDNPFYKKHFGSSIAAEFCKKNQPLVCIGGHMHEHFAKCKLGKTTVINAGFGPKVNTLLEIKNNKIKSIKFWDGKNEFQ